MVLTESRSVHSQFRRSTASNLPADGDGYYLEMQVGSDSLDNSEVAVTRRVPLDDISDEEWQELKVQYASLTLMGYQEIKELPRLEKIHDSLKIVHGIADLLEP